MPVAHAVRIKWSRLLLRAFSVTLRRVFVELLMSQWLLSTGPTHQIGVGCLVLHPDDRSKMLVAQEKTGPVAAYTVRCASKDLAVIRERKEETGFEMKFGGILQVRQVHPSSTTSDRKLFRTSSNSSVCVYLGVVERQ
jgi:hypothetical protein